MKQRLAEGDLAPAFDVTDMAGRVVNFDAFHSKYLLMTFMRYSGCPYCNLAVHRLALEYKRLRQHDCEVVVFVQSQKSEIQANIYDRHAVKPVFSIIADPAMHVYEDYGVTASATGALHMIKNLPYWVHAVRHHGFKQQAVDGNLFVVPAHFLIDRHSKQIVQASYGSSFYEHKTFTPIYQTLTFNETA